jgi:catechol 2,3-dioxygenase-like lactoylglutathione lyase family enzyme
MKDSRDIIPVSDADRAKQFYRRLGWRLDGDDSPLEGVRIVQFTPPGSADSVTFGQGLTPAAPGSAVGGLTVSDIEAPHDDLVSRGIDALDNLARHACASGRAAARPGPRPHQLRVVLILQ